MFDKWGDGYVYPMEKCMQIQCEDCQDTGELENGEFCQECCEHGDYDHGICGSCGADCYDDLAGRAYDSYKDSVKYGD